MESTEHESNEHEIDEHEQQCSICSSTASLLQIQEKWICEECLRTGIEKLTSRWKESLEALLKEYSEACNQCLSDDHPEFIQQAREIGLKVRAVLEFLGIPKNHDLLLAVREMHRLFNKVREVDVFLDEMKNKSDDNKAYAALVKAVAKKQKKQLKQIQEKIPSIINNSFSNKVEKFINNDLVFYILSFVKENVLFQYEEFFSRLVDDFHRTVEEKGQTTAETIKALHAVQKKSTSLFYIYQYLNETFDENSQDKETYYKHLQQQFSDINDTEAWFSQIKEYEKKIDVPKSEIDNVKKIVKERLLDLLQNVGHFEEPVKEM